MMMNLPSQPMVGSFVGRILGDSVNTALQMGQIRQQQQMALLHRAAMLPSPVLTAPPKNDGYQEGFSVDDTPPVQEGFSTQTYIPRTLVTKAHDDVPYQEGFSRSEGGPSRLVTRELSDAERHPTLISNTRPQDFATAEEYVASKGTNLFRGDTSPIELDKYDVEFGLKQGKELGGAMAEGPGIYFTTDIKNAKAYGQNITDAVLDNNAVIVDKQFKKFTKPQIMKIVESVDKEHLDNSLSNWDENPSTAKRLLVDALYDANTAQDQIINIWADVFYHQSPNEFMKLMSDNGVHGLKIDKDGLSHYVIFDRSKLQTKSQLIAEWQAAQGNK